MANTASSRTCYDSRFVESYHIAIGNLRGYTACSNTSTNDTSTTGSSCSISPRGITSPNTYHHSPRCCRRYYALIGAKNAWVLSETDTTKVFWGVEKDSYEFLTSYKEQLHALGLTESKASNFIA